MIEVKPTVQYSRTKRPVSYLKLYLSFVVINCLRYKRGLFIYPSMFILMIMLQKDVFHYISRQYVVVPRNTIKLLYAKKFG